MLAKGLNRRVLKLQLGHSRRAQLTSAQQDAVKRIKLPSRGGQNLSDRYVRLEKSLRGKEARMKHIDESPVYPTATKDKESLVPLVRRGPVLRTFKGLVIPERPKPPEEDGTFVFPINLSYLLYSIECCMSGCAICVHDLYQESLNDYNDSISALKASLLALNVPRSEWPEEIGGEEAKEVQKSTSLSAFEKLEMALKEKHMKENVGRVECLTP